MRGQNWTEPEVRALVDDYLDMLGKDLRADRYSKTQHRNRLLGILTSRNEASIERKHQNVSAVLRDCGLPFVDGYKPLGNYQQLLADVVLERLGRSTDLYRTADRVSAALPAVHDAVRWADSTREVEAPEPYQGEATGRAMARRPASTRDYAERDARNAELGKLGERFILEVERRRLTEAGHKQLAAKIEWTSNERGDGFGYDVTSFDRLGKPIFIEVKTTNLGMRFPFIATRNEVSVSESMDSAYRLYRVFHFSKDARFFVLPGSLTRSCHLQPRTYVARF